jgi:ATP-dependent RNA helicase RhlE
MRAIQPFTLLINQDHRRLPKNGESNLTMKFSDLGLCQSLLDAVSAKGYDTPSPIQAKAIPAILEGKDVMAAAQTGTGKTAGFTLPILENLSKGTHAKYNQARVLVLTPTRELAAQVGESVKTYGQNLPLRSAVVFGGVKINPQMQKLRGGVDVLVATPGRLLDLYSQNAVKFDHLEVLVLDEADRMLDMGFIHDIRKIIKLLPQQRQNLMFSATFSKDIRQLAKTIVNQPVEISVTPENAAAPTVKQWIVPVDKSRKAALLIKLIKENDWWQVLVFSRTKHGANKLAKKLDAAGIHAAAIHGNKSQGARTRALADFKANKVQVLVATDIAARGLDINQLPQVVNFDLPNVPEDYVHRIGRTGRAGSEGQAVSLVSADELQQLKDIERLTKKLLEREYVEGFDPQHDLPETQLNTKPSKAKKPKKPKQSQSRSGGQHSGSGRRDDRSSNKSSNDGGNRTNNNRRRGGKASSGKASSGNPNSGNSSAGKPNSGKPQSGEQKQSGQKNRTISSGAGRRDDGNTSWPQKKRQRPKNDPRGPK